MPQATTLRLVRGSTDRNPATASAYALINQHISQTTRLTSLASRVATDAEILSEALRYFTVAPQMRR